MNLNKGRHHICVKINSNKKKRGFRVIWNSSQPARSKMILDNECCVVKIIEDIIYDLVSQPPNIKHQYLSAILYAM